MTTTTRRASGQSESLAAAEARIEDVSRRIDFFHEMLDERLQLKDRWIRDSLDGTRREVHAMLDGLRAEIKGEANKTEGQVDALALSIEALDKTVRNYYDTAIERLNIRYDELLKSMQSDKESRERQAKLIIDGHLEVHKIAERSLDEFRGTVAQRLDALQKVIDDLKIERNLFVRREAHETQIDTVAQSTAINMKALSEKFEAQLARIEESVSARVTTNTDRIAKLEQNLHAMNARNQQSILALGLVLTAVEIALRLK